MPITTTLPLAAAELVGLAYDCDDTGDGLVTRRRRCSVSVTAPRGRLVQLAAELRSLGLTRVAAKITAKIAVAS